MSNIFSSVIADLANDLAMRFPPDFDFKAMLSKVSEDAGVCIKFEKSGDGNCYKLQGLWYAVEQAYRLLVTALAVHGIRQADEDGNTLVPKLHTVNLLTPSQTDRTTCTQFSKETAKHKSDKVKSTEEKFASFLVAKSDISCGEGGSDSRADKMHQGLSVVTHSPPDAHDDLHGDLGVGKHSLRHTQDDHLASETDKPDNTQNKSWLDNGSKLWNQNLEKKAVSQSSCEMHERGAYNLPLRKQQKWGRPGKSAPKQLSQVNHKYSFLSKYRDQSYPSLGRTVRKRKAVLPVNANPSDIVKKKRGRPKKYKDQGQTVFACCECEFVATSRSKLTDHHHRRHKGNPVSCDLCGKIFHNQMYMLRHRSSHTGPQHCCDVCGKMFKIQKAMTNHRKTHEEGYTRPVFPCKLCSKSFCSQYIVDCHVKSIHMGQKKSYLCSYCGKKFTTKHSLQEHVNAHSGIKPHVCEICGKGFSYDSALRDHKFTHDDVKQFKCDLCNKSFCQRSGLKMHMRIHRDTKQFQCQECGREFTQKQALQRHERVHKGVKPFTCKLCSRSFTDASIIRRHLTLVHKIYKDAKTWREDITCTIKPDMQYHVSYVGLREPEPEQERAQVNRSQTEARTVLQCKAQSGRDTNRNSLPGQDLRNSAMPLTASLNSVCANSESVYSTSEGRGPPSTHHGQLGTLSVSTHAQAMSAASQTLFQNSGYHPQPQPPSSSCMEMPCSDAELSLASVTAALNHTAAAAVSRQGLFDASIPSHSNYTAAAAVSSGRQGLVEVIVSSQSSHTATATARRPGLIDVGNPLYSMDKARQEVSSLHANSSYSASVHPAFPHGPFVQSNPLGEPQHRDLTVSSQQSHHSTKEDAVTTATTITTATLTPIAAPQPWSSLYYYSQLASQFGMSFADYPYITNTAFSGVNLGPSSPGLEHSSPIHPRLQASGQTNVDLSQGQGGREASDLYNGSHGLTLTSPMLELSHSGVLLDGGAEVHMPGVTGVTHSPLGNQKCGLNVPGSSSS